MTGADILAGFPRVNRHFSHLSTSLPDLTPQKSVAQASFSVVRLITNSPDSRII